MKTTYLDKGLVEIFIAEHLFFSKDYERALKPNLRLGAKSYALFDLNSALKFTERAEICAENTGDKRMLTTALKQKGLVLESIHRFGEAVEAYEKSLEIDREIGDRAAEAANLHQIGKVYRDTNRFREALEYFNESLAIKREIEDRAGEAATLHQIGTVYQLTNQFEEALEYYNESLKASREREEEAGERAETESVAEEEIKENAIGLKP
jgi:tetratricopeptide (TPR) repeat protein